jgi:UDP-N-acetyl-D-mannosaminuronic acid dehydrogenase
MLEALARNRARRPDAIAIRAGTPTGWELTTWAEFHRDVVRAAAGVRALNADGRIVVVVDGSAGSLATVVGCVTSGVDALLIEEQGVNLEDLHPALRGAVVVGPGGVPHEECRATATEVYGQPGEILQFTSGSTGERRIVRQPLSHIAHGGSMYAEAFRWGEQDAILAAVPLAHSFGLVGGLAAAVACTGALWTLHRFSLRTLVAGLSDGATALLGTPLVYRLLVPTLHNRGSFPRLRTVLSSGGPLEPELADRVRKGLGSRVRQIYGSTETGLVAYQPDDDTWPAEAVGVPAHGVALSVDSGGQLLVHTPTLLRGYAGGDAPLLTPDGFYPTGDVAMLDEVGRLYLTGRKETFVNVGGRKVNPARVERLIGSHEGVREVYVYGRVHDGEERVHAAVVLAPGTSVPDVAAFCRRRGLRPYEVPHHFHPMDRLPRGPMGKVDRRKVLAAAHDDIDGVVERRVAVVGMGYVGLTLAVSLARAGLPVVGVEADPRVREAVAAGDPLLFEPGVAELLRALPPGRLTVADALPETPLRAVVICVGTPVDPSTRRPDLRDMTAVAASVAARIAADTLVVVRSTVPVGTSRQVVYEKLRERVAEPLLAFCPERTIQGRALAELASLPQIIGGVNDRSVALARELFASLTSDHVMVSTLEAAELVKLACNAHTDLIYGFGNEIALTAEALGVDGNEVIAAANPGYPRPDLSRPGYVGGSCLTKDPYLLIHSAQQSGHHPRMVAAARAVNEQVPVAAVDRVVKALAAIGSPAADAKVLVCGIAYKGSPPTDDVRGSAAIDVARALRRRVNVLAGHDYIVEPARVAQVGYTPSSLPDGLDGADVLMLLSDHPGYREDVTAELVRTRMRRPAIVFDMWGTLRDELDGHADIEYLRLGRG